MTALRAGFAAISRNWPWAVLAACALMLGTAHYFETFQGLAPCEMCLKQRLAYWIAGGVALVGAIAGCTPLRVPTFRLVCVLISASLLYGLFYAGWQAGAEQHWWLAPQTCSSGSHLKPVSAADISALLNGTSHQRIVPCDKPVWWFLGLTMAAWDVAVLTVLVIWTGVAAARGAKK